MPETSNYHLKKYATTDAVDFQNVENFNMDTIDTALASIKSSASGGSSYTLPIASSSTLGGVKIGSNISIASDGKISATDTKYSLPTASSSTLGGVKIGSNISISSGTISVSAANIKSALGATPLKKVVGTFTLPCPTGQSRPVSTTTVTITLPSAIEGAPDILFIQCHNYTNQTKTSPPYTMMWAAGESTGNGSINTTYVSSGHKLTITSTNPFGWFYTCTYSYTVLD